MTFIWPAMLVLLLLVPVFVLYYLRIQARRRQIIANSASLGLIQNASGRGPGFLRHIPPLIFLIALVIMIVALARPQAEVSLPRIEGTVILAFDVSGSMAANDIEPTRIEAAKAAVQDFVQRQPPTIQIGVIAFSDNGFSVQPPTYDQTDVLAAIDRLAPARGTSLANGILIALQTIEAVQHPPTTNYYSNLTPTPEPSPTPMPQGTYTPAVIILLTDGENNENPDPLQAAQTAADRGVRIYTVGIGSPAGTDLHVDGFTVHTQLDESTLQQISQITGGVYYNAQTEAQLHEVYDNLTPELVIKPQELEITPLFAGLGIVVMLIAGMLSLLWFGRVP